MGRGGAKCWITPGPHTQPFGGARHYVRTVMYFIWCAYMLTSSATGSILGLPRGRGGLGCTSTAQRKAIFRVGDWSTCGPSKPLALSLLSRCFTSPFTPTLVNGCGRKLMQIRLLFAVFCFIQLHVVNVLRPHKKRTHISSVFGRVFLSCGRAQEPQDGFESNFLVALRCTANACHYLSSLLLVHLLC